MQQSRFTAVPTTVMYLTGMNISSDLRELRRPRINAVTLLRGRFDPLHLLRLTRFAEVSQENPICRSMKQMYHLRYCIKWCVDAHNENLLYPLKHLSYTVLVCCKFVDFIFTDIWLYLTCSTQSMQQVLCSSPRYKSIDILSLLPVCRCNGVSRFLRFILSTHDIAKDITQSIDRVGPFLGMISPHEGHWAPSV